jgi:hypothetical protein
MADRRSDRLQAQFAESLQSANNQITDTQAFELFQVRDAVNALLAFRKGERIVIDKTQRNAALQ